MIGLFFLFTCLGYTISSNNARIPVLNKSFVPLFFFLDIIVDFDFYFGTTLSSFLACDKTASLSDVDPRVSLTTRMILTQQNLLQVCFNTVMSELLVLGGYIWHNVTTQHGKQLYLQAHNQLLLRRLVS